MVGDGLVDGLLKPMDLRPVVREVLFGVFQPAPGGGALFVLGVLEFSEGPVAHHAMLFTPAA